MGHELIALPDKSASGRDGERTDHGLAKSILKVHSSKTPELEPRTRGRHDTCSPTWRPARRKQPRTCQHCNDTHIVRRCQFRFSAKRSFGDFKSSPWLVSVLRSQLTVPTAARGGDADPVTAAGSEAGFTWRRCGRVCAFQTRAAFGRRQPRAYKMPILACCSWSAVGQVPWLFMVPWDAAGNDLQQDRIVIRQRRTSQAIRHC